NARNFGTLINTFMGIKKAVHKIFKNSISKMNCNNIELDFILQHNTLQTICHQVDGDKDSRYLYIGQGFQNFTRDLLLQSILSDLYMIQNIHEKDTDI
ncbi:303_t:CDS:1, partial [Racocetra persica]